MSIFALALLLLTAVNYAISRSVLYPPFLFCAVWTLQIVGLRWAGDFFYPLAQETLWVFLIGAVGFTVGGFVSMLLKYGPPAPEPDKETLRYIDIILKISLACGIVLLPFYWNHLNQLAGGGDVANFWKELRMATLKHAATDIRDINPMLATVPFFSILAVISFYESFRTGTEWLRTCGSVTISLLYHLGSTARSEVLILLVGLFVAAWFHSPRKALRYGFIGLCGFFILFFFNQLKIEKAGSRSTDSVVDNIPQFKVGLAIYSLGSAVAFDGTVRYPGLIVNTFPITSYFNKVLSKFGAYSEDLIPFMEDINVNSTFAINAYTVYFSYYYGYGLGGTLFFLMVLGFIATLVFFKASANDPVYVLVYGLALYCTVTSFFADFFVLEMGFWIKAFAVGTLCYRAIPALVKRKRRPAVIRRAVAA